MSLNGRLRRASLERAIEESLRRLAGSVDAKSLPLSEEELRTLARRQRESVFGSERKKDRLERYRRHLASLHGVEVVAALSEKLTEINNQMAWEEK